MGENVDDRAEGVADVKTPHTPGLVGDPVDDLQAHPFGLRMDFVDIVHLDR